MVTTKPLTRCLACDSADLGSVYDFGCMPPANLLLDSRFDSFPVFPLELMRCHDCGHGQLSHSVDPVYLFRNYAYASGTSQTLKAYFKWFARELAAAVVQEGHNPHTVRILEIACNDGSLLKELRWQGFQCVGVEPDTALSKQAAMPGLEVVNDFWPCDLPGEEPFDFVIAMNVVAHVRDPATFLMGCRSVLAPFGRILVQVSQGDMVENGQFDTIYHEHLSFFSPMSMVRTATRGGLVVNSQHRVSVHGDSVLYSLSQISIPTIYDAFQKGDFARPGTPKCPTDTLWHAFTRRVDDTRGDIELEISCYILEGYTIAFVGAAAKAITVLQVLSTKPDVVLDEALLKIGKWIPDLDIQIEHLDAIAEPDKVLAVISAWNFKDELVAKVMEHRKGKRTAFMTYFPTGVESWDIPATLELS